MKKIQPALEGFAITLERQNMLKFLRQPENNTKAYGSGSSLGS
jgi:hypothetical protein